MSVITDALQKAQSRSFPDRTSTDSSPSPGSPGRWPWWSAGVALAGLAIVWLWVGGGLHWPVSPRRAAAPTAPAAAPAPILSLLPGNPASPALGWRVDGVITGMGEPLAIINGTTVAEGEQVADGTTVVSVTRKSVELERDDGQRMTLAVAER